jgi:hypothetical protein
MLLDAAMPDAEIILPERADGVMAPEAKVGPVTPVEVAEERLPLSAIWTGCS